MSMVWDVHGRVHYEQLWLTVPCSDDSTVFSFHFWRLSGLHVVPFRGCLGGSCILLCAYEREMNFSVLKCCKKGLCKKAACSYWRGKISSPDNATSCLQNRNGFGLASEMPRKTSDAFQSSVRLWDLNDSLGSAVLRIKTIAEAVHLKPPIRFPDFNLHL